MTVIDRLIYDMDMTWFRLSDDVPDGVDYHDWAWNVRQAESAIAYHAQTGRFSMETVHAIQKCRLYNLLKYMALQDDHSTDGYIHSMYDYLKRNRKLVE